jgi:hypothetical protein
MARDAAGAHRTRDYLEHAGLPVVRCIRLSRTSKARRVLAGIAVAIAATLVFFAAWSYEACAVYDSSLLLPNASDAASSTDAGADSDPCTHVRPPGPPDGGESDGGTIQVIAAFKTIDIGLTADASAPRPPFGYDLDGVCTCPGQPSCAQPKGAPISCDDDAGGNTGRDNTDIDLFRALGDTASTGTTQIDDGLRSGQYGLLLVIDNYNGQLNDPRVAVSYYVSNGVNRTSDGGIRAPDFMGDDLWTIDPNSLQDRGQDPTSIQSCAHNPQCQSVFYDDQAYVTNGFVVAHFNQLTVAFGDRSFLGGATMALSNAVVVGELQVVSLPVGFSYELVGGTIAGRWPTKALLQTLATIPDPATDGGFLCGHDNVLISNYDILKAVVCEAADISQNQANDNTGAACDAVSVGMTFTAGPAQLGAVFAVPPAPAGCGDGGFPFTDNCP